MSVLLQPPQLGASEATPALLRPLSRNHILGTVPLQRRTIALQF